MSDLEHFTLQKFIKMVHEKNVSNEFLVQICELSGSFLNLKTISDYAKENKMSYNGVKNHRNIVVIFNTKYVIDND